MRIRRFEGKIAIVTGGSSGIGRAVSRALAREGALVAVAGKTPSHVEETLALIESDLGDAGNHHIGLCLDVRSEQDMSDMAARTLERYGRIDVLVASAGVSATTTGSKAPVASLSLAAWNEVVDTNLRGVFLANRAVLPAMMRQREGEILNVSSSLGMARGWAFASAYCASKFAVLGLSESLAEEVQSFGVRVQVLLPDAVDTPMLERLHLAIPGSVPAPEAAACVLEMLGAPRDLVLANPVIEPFGAWEKTGQRKALGT